MRVTRLDPDPVHRIRYLNAGRRGKTVSTVLPVLRGQAQGLPEGLAALVLTSDLQGVASSWRRRGAHRLLGIILADELRSLAEQGVLPDPDRTGVVLAGDLYSAPAGNVRGASGDVRQVWMEFAKAYRWVVGVQGNHDRFGAEHERAELQEAEGLHLLDGDVVELDGLAVGGVGEIIGDPNKPGRKSEGEFLAALELVVETAPRLLVLHEGPAGGEQQWGSELVRTRVQPLDGLVVCGHSHWDEPLFEPATGPQVLNVDARVVVLTAAQP